MPFTVLQSCPLMLTATGTVALVLPTGTRHSMLVAPMSWCADTTTVPKRQKAELIGIGMASDVAPTLCVNPVPVSVTIVPPNIGPRVGYT